MVGARLCDSAAENVCRANAGHESPRPNVVERVRDRGGDQDRGFEDGHDPELRGQRPPFRLIVRGDRSVRDVFHAFRHLDSSLVLRCGQSVRDGFPRLPGSKTSRVSWHSGRSGKPPRAARPRGLSVLSTNGRFHSRSRLSLPWLDEPAGSLNSAVGRRKDSCATRATARSKLRTCWGSWQRGRDHKRSGSLMSNKHRYGHKTIRARWRPKVKTGTVECARCGELISRTISGTSATSMTVGRGSMRAQNIVDATEQYRRSRPGKHLAAQKGDDDAPAPKRASSSRWGVERWS